MDGVVSTDELIAKARAAATPGELQAAAFKEGVGIPLEEPSGVHSRLNRRGAESSDCELDGVLGGGRGDPPAGTKRRHRVKRVRQATREVLLGPKRTWHCGACDGTR